MISDVLSDAAADIRDYLAKPATQDCYQGELRDRINRLLAEMDAVRIYLDTSPDQLEGLDHA
jgi:hypothetical protein